MKAIKIIFLMLFAMHLYGQEAGLKKASATFTLGMNYSMTELNMSGIESYSPDDSLTGLGIKQGSGFHIGYGFLQEISENVSLSAGVMLYFNSGSVEYEFRDSEKVIASMDYAFADIPFYVRVSPLRSVPEFHVFSGTRIRINTGYNSDRADDIIKLKRNAVSVDIGVGYDITLKNYILPVDLAFSVGATNFHRNYDNLYNNPISELNFSNVSLSFSFYKKPQD